MTDHTQTAAPLAGATLRPERLPATATIKLRADPRSAALVRRFTRDVVSGHPTHPLLDTAACELATNALKAAIRLAEETGFPWQDHDQPVHFHVHATDRWTLIGARDPHPDDPRRCQAGPDAENGRGLQILETVSHRWWTWHTEFYKTVWFLVPVPDVALVGEDIAAAGMQAAGRCAQ